MDAPKLQNFNSKRGQQLPQSLYTQGWFPQQILGEVPQEQKVLKGHLLRVIYHQVFLYTKIKFLPLEVDKHLGKWLRGVGRL